MNEKFKKDEVWGYLGKAKHRDNMESLHDDTIVCQTSGDQEGDGLATEADSKVGVGRFSLTNWYTVEVYFYTYVVNQNVWTFNLHPV